MTDNEFLLFDRITKIRSVFNQYGIDNFYISFSGGKDSTVLSYLIDLALPDNKIPRVYANTGIEMNMIRDFVLDMQKKDDRIVIIKPSVPIKPTLEKYGYPFKSKRHSSLLETYQKYKTLEGRIGIQHYLGVSEDGISWSPIATCPEKLKFQFSPDYPLKISDKCCEMMKERPMGKWAKENNKPYAIIGIMRDEGGRRYNAECLAFRGKKLFAFQPLSPVTKEWEDWFIEEYKIKVCDIYYPPYNFVRTGCKGCPFALTLQRDLDILEQYFPNERKQCEIIWKPVYEEYRRLGYRLKPVGAEQEEHDPRQMTFDDLFDEQGNYIR